MDRKISLKKEKVEGRRLIFKKKKKKWEEILCPEWFLHPWKKKSYYIINSMTYDLENFIRLGFGSQLLKKSHEKGLSAVIRVNLAAGKWESASSAATMGLRAGSAGERGRAAPLGAGAPWPETSGLLRPLRCRRTRWSPGPLPPAPAPGGCRG